MRAGDKEVAKADGAQEDKAVRSHGVVQVDKVVAAVGEDGAIEEYFPIKCAVHTSLSHISLKFLS